MGLKLFKKKKREIWPILLPYVVEERNESFDRKSEAVLSSGFFTHILDWRSVRFLRSSKINDYISMHDTLDEKSREIHGIFFAYAKAFVNDWMFADDYDEELTNEERVMNFKINEEESVHPCSSVHYLCSFLFFPSTALDSVFIYMTRLIIAISVLCSENSSTCFLSIFILIWSENLIV